METENKLPKEFKEKWIAALRSGEYKQAYGTLVSGDGYCCLGVACLLSGYVNNDLYGCALIPAKLENVPKILIDGISQIPDLLTDMNDFDHLTFPEIADWIEENL